MGTHSYGDVGTWDVSLQGHGDTWLWGYGVTGTWGHGDTRWARRDTGPWGRAARSQPATTLRSPAGGGAAARPAPPLHWLPALPLPPALSPLADKPAVARRLGSAGGGGGGSALGRVHPAAR